MKDQLVLLLGFCLHMTSVVNVSRISLSVRNANLENVFKEIHNQTGYHFIYVSQLVAAAPTITITIKDAPITEALDLICKRMKLQYAIIDSTIVIRAGNNLSRAGPVAINCKAHFSVGENGLCGK